jgi:hypothetical protein
MRFPFQEENNCGSKHFHYQVAARLGMAAQHSLESIDEKRMRQKQERLEISAELS